MKISLDFDDTFTRDPIGWSAFVTMMLNRGHDVMIVTWRNVEEAKEVEIEMNYWKLPIQVYATDRVAKEKFMFALGINIDVFIDDNPRSIIQDMVKL